MSLEVAYWIALGAGTAFLVLSIVLGDVFDFLDFLDFGLGDSFAATPVLFTSLAAFGGGGLLALNAFGLGAGASIFAGLGSSILAGGLAAALFLALHRQEAGPGFTFDQLVGARGRCTLAISSGKEGKVAILHDGMTRNLSAGSRHEIAVGEDVVVDDAVGNSLRVSPVNQP
ncbi:hypothetical protein BH23ACT12_BH23ACT12_12670 [soil metagenome]